MKPGFIIGNYSRQKSTSFFLSVLEMFRTHVFSGYLVCDGEHLRYPLCADFSEAYFSNHGHNRRSSDTYCDAKLTCCDAAIIPHQHINLVSVSVVAAVVGQLLWNFSPIFTALKMTDIASELTSLASSTHTHTHGCQMSMDHHRTAAFGSKKCNHHSLPSTYGHINRHFSLLLRRMHVTDRSTDDPVGGGQCRSPVDKAKVYPKPHLKETNLEALLRVFIFVSTNLYQCP